MIRPETGGGLYVPAGAWVSLRHSDFADRDAKLLERGDRLYMTRDLARLMADGLGSGDISAPPRLGARWVPRAESSLADAGEIVPGLTVDLLGHPRVVGAAPDMGPIERW